MIEFRPGKDDRGRPDLHVDGEPAWWESTCGRYTVSRDHREDRRYDVYFGWIRDTPRARDVPGKYRSLAKTTEAIEKWIEIHPEDAGVPK